MTQLANLRSLAKLLPEINSHPTDTPRQRAGKSLLAVLEYLRLAEIQHGALLALSRELSELEGTGRKGVILTASLQARGRGKTGAEIRCAQGVCAGVLELKFRETGSLDEAAKWVSRARALCIVVGDLSHAKTCRIRHIEFLANRASMPWSPPRPQQYESDWERRLATAMRERGLKPLPQYPVGTRYLDFAIDPDGKKIDIEVDGRRWHTDASGNRKVADRLRDIELEGRGWTVLRFWVHELANNMEICLDRIEQALVG